MSLGGTTPVAVSLLMAACSLFGQTLERNSNGTQAAPLSSYPGHVASSPRDYGAHLITCSPAPCVLPPTQASEGGAEVTDTPIIANPRYPAHLLLGSVDGNCPFGSTSGFHVSTDGGSSWSVTCMPIIRKGRVYYVGGQPMVGYDLNGTAYIADTYGDSEGLGYGFIGIQKSTDGINWSEPMVTLNEGQAFPLYSWMTVDTNAGSSHVGSVYISAVVLNDSLTLSQIAVSHSNDGGKSWTTAPIGSKRPGPEQDLFTHLSVAKDGTIYLTWLHCAGSGKAAGCDNGTAYMLFSKSSDGGNTWSPPALMTTITLSPSGLPNTTGIRVYDYPVSGVDDSDGPYAGNLYVAMYSWTGTHMRVQVVRSTDGGSSWSKPVYVAPASDNHDQFFPWLSVSSTGLVGVSWLDRRNDPENVNYQAFAAISTDGGQNFQPNTLLTDKFSNPNVGNEVWMGDYSGNTWDGPDYFIAAWMDGSNGVDMQEEVGGIRLK